MPRCSRSAKRRWFFIRSKIKASRRETGSFRSWIVSEPEQALRARAEMAEKKVVIAPIGGPKRIPDFSPVDIRPFFVLSRRYACADEVPLPYVRRLQLKDITLQC